MRAAAANKDEQREDSSSYFFFAGFPLRPLLKRRTLRSELVPGRVWEFVQPLGLGFSRVTVNVRMTVVRMRDGGLFVYAPIAPTAECRRLIEELGEPVRVIILSTNAIEHKACFGPFCRRYASDAKVFVVPETWSFPLDLPLPFLGIRNAKVLGSDTAAEAEAFGNEFDYESFIASFSDLGPYVEVSFFHKDTKTLLVTDACVYVPREPPPGASVADCLDAARNGEDKDEAGVADTPRNRQIGWARTVMQVLFFGPRDLKLSGWETRDEPAGFDAVAEKVIVSPVVRELVFNEVPLDVRDWAEKMCAWDFERIISAHFEAPIEANPDVLRRAFAFAYAAARAEEEEEEKIEQEYYSGGKDLNDIAFVEATNMTPDLGALNSLNRILRFVGAKKKKKRKKKQGADEANTSSAV